MSHFKNGAWLDRGYLSVNAIYQTATPSFTQTQSWTYFAETASVSIEYPGESAPGVDIAGGWRVWRNLAIGAGLAVVSRPSTTVVSGSMPNPLYANRPTTLSGGFEAKHSETAIHVQASWTMPLKPKMVLMVFGGPSFVNVTQTIVQAEGIGTSIPYPVRQRDDHVREHDEPIGDGVRVLGRRRLHLLPLEDPRRRRHRPLRPGVRGFPGDRPAVRAGEGGRAAGRRRAAGVLPAAEAREAGGAAKPPEKPKAPVKK